MALTDSAIRALKPQPKPYKVSGEKGLYLLVTPSGGRRCGRNHTLLRKDNMVGLPHHQTPGLYT